MGKAKTNSEKERLGLAGEYRVLSELLLRDFNATITTGRSKGTDILIFLKNKKYLRIEVKTSKNGRNFVTSFYPKYSEKSVTDPDLWIFFLPKNVSTDDKVSEDIFYILSHDEVKKMQLKVNKGNETKRGEGVDNIPLKLFKEISSGNWEKLKKYE